MTTILAVDPSAERESSDTGWFLGEFFEDQPVRRLDSGNIHGGFEGFKRWTGPAADIVVCEHYVVFNRAGDPTPLLVEGALRDRYDDVVLQPASGKNTAVPDRVLKALDLYTTAGHHQDEREAARHAVWYLKKIKHLPTLRVGW
jgi:hypothetical protein